MRAARALHAAILRLAPHAFRSAYAAQADAAFAALLRDRRRRGRFAVLSCSIAALADAIRTVARERAASMRWPSWTGVVDDPRAAARGLWRHRAYSSAVVLTLGLSAGVLAAVFAFVDPMLWRPLPLPEADRLVVGWAEGEGVRFNQLQKADYVRLLAPTASFEAVASYYGAGWGPIDGAAPIQLIAVTPAFFEALEVAPAVGRAFTPDEHRGRLARVAIVSHDLWRQRFGARPDIIGQTFELRGREPQRYEVIGVLPPEFVMPWQYGALPDALVPGALATSAVVNLRESVPIVARLRTGATLEAATAELRSVARRTERSNPALAQNRTVDLVPLRRLMFGDVQTTLWLLLLSAGGVVLVAMANLAHLVRSRLHGREQELSVRVAIGASRARLLRLLMWEVVWLVAAGAGLAWIAGRVGLQAITNALPFYEASYTRLPASFDARIVTALVIVVGVMTLGIHAVTMGRVLRGSLARTPTRSTGRQGSELGFVFTQAAIAMALVVCGLQVASAFLDMRRQMSGFNPHSLTALSLAWIATPTHPPAVHALQMRSARALDDAFGGRIAAFTAIPGDRAGLGRVRRAERAPHRASTHPDSVRAVSATPNAFGLLGLNLLTGRLMTDAEVWSDAPVAIADRRSTELLWPSDDPVGRWIVDASDSDNEIERQIVGVVENLPSIQAQGEFRRGVVFVPFSRTKQSVFNFLYKRESGAPSPNDVVRVLQDVDAGALATPYPYLPHEARLGPVRFATLALVTLSTLTVVLAAIGLFGIVSHAVGARVREIAVRVALGARPFSVTRLMLGQYVAAVAAGLGLGAGLALQGSTSFADVRGSVRPDNGASFVIAALLLLGVVAAACYLPARRASRIDPALALRAE